jgi:hypothetical protein
MDINLGGLLVLATMARRNPGLDVRDEDRFYAQWGSEGRLFARTREIIAVVRRVGLAALTATRALRPGESRRVAVASAVIG